MRELIGVQVNDPLVYAFLSGAVATLITVVIYISAILLGVVKYTGGHYLASLVFPDVEIDFPKLVMGELVHTLAGGTLGLLLLATFITGVKFALLKGIGLGAVLWIIHVLVVPHFAAPRINLFRTFEEATVDLAAHTAWGFFTALLILKFMVFS
ncbi:MAG: hypothetical protein ACYCX4_05855 [Bacillota bacterium]